MKQNLLQSLRLRFALLVALLCSLGTGTAWADTAGFTLGSAAAVPLASGSTKTTTITGSASETWSVEITGNWTSSSMQGIAGSKYWQMGKNGSAISSAIFSTSGISGTITSVVVNCASYNGITKVNCTVGGSNFGTQNQSSATWASNTGGDVTFSGSASGAIVVTLDNSGASARAAYIQSITVTYSTGGGPVTYSVSYNGNGATSGTAPTDSNSPYTSGSTVTVLDNTGSLAKTGYSFGGWNTKSDGKGTDYSAGATFSITASTTLYAKWNFVITDGLFDFVNAANAGEDYGSGMTLVSSGFTTDDATWEAVNVTMVTSCVSGNGYRWWSSDGTLRFYNESNATFSVPSGYVITKIVTTGANFDSSSPSGLSGSTWTGASNAVTLTATGTRNIKTITVTYTTENQSVTVSEAGYATYCSPYALNYTGKGIKAYIPTATSASSVTLKQVYRIPANTGIILNYAGGTTENIPVFDGTSTDVAGNLFAVSDGTVEGDGTIYALGNKDGIGFYPVKSGVNVPAGKPYLTVGGGGSVKEFLSFDFGDADGINTVQGSGFKVQDSEIFNLAGQKMSRLQKGINIVNGKKVFVK